MSSINNEKWPFGEANSSSNDSASVTHWIGALRDCGDEAAARKLWEKYWDQLVARLRAKIHPGARQATDEEDLALSAFDSLFRGISTGRYPDLSDREGLWCLLLTIADRRANRHREREFAQKRGGGKVLCEQQLMKQADDEDALGLAGFAQQGPSPQFALIIADEVEQRLEKLGDPVLREIVLLEMEGYNAGEIKEKLELGSLRTVYRKRNLIRTMWAEQESSDADTA